MGEPVQHTQASDSSNRHEEPQLMTYLNQLLTARDVDRSIYPILERCGIRRPTEVQKFSIFGGLFEGENLLVSAATSAGKTLVGELACVNTILHQKKRCLYLVPLKSLANEKYRSFQARWDELGITVEMSTGDMNLLDRAAEEEKLKTTDLLITTYERADSILRSSPEWFREVQVVVVDEVHNIQSDSRGARLEGLLLRLRFHFPSIQFIYLSATIGNPEELAEWVGARLIQHDHRPVPLEYQVVLTPNRTEQIKRIVQQTLLQRGSVLIFAPTRFEAEQLCSEVSKYLRDQELLYLIEGRQLRATVNQLHEEIGNRLDRRLFFSIPSGVSFHHAGLSRQMRELVEGLFREGLVKVIAATPTLSSGVNLPAKVVVIKDVGLAGSFRTLGLNELHQMCGRAGRPGYDDKGFAIVLAQHPGEKEEVRLLYFQAAPEPAQLIPKYDPIESQFMDPENLLEQFLIWIAESPGGVKELELGDLTYRTFWYASTRKRHPDLNIDHLVRIGYYSLENLLIRRSTPEAIQGARTIPDDAVSIRLMHPHKLEAIVQDRFYLKVYFSQERPDCACGAFDVKNSRNAPLCRHLVKLAQIAYPLNPSYTKNIVLASLHEENIVDRLLQYRMIKILNRKLQITEFGRQTVLLYLRPSTAFWIRRQLPRIDSQQKLYHALLYAYDLERKFRLKPQHSEIIKRIFEDDLYKDLEYQIDKLTNEFRIHPGDMEEFVETLRWIIHCFHTLAEMDQSRQVLEWTAPMIEHLTIMDKKDAEEGEVLRSRGS